MKMISTKLYIRHKTWAQCTRNGQIQEKQMNICEQKSEYIKHESRYSVVEPISGRLANVSLAYQPNQP